MSRHTGNPGDFAPVPPERTGDSTEGRTEVFEPRYPICPECNANLLPTPVRIGVVAFDNWPISCPDCGLKFGTSSPEQLMGAGRRAAEKKRLAQLALNTILAHHDDANNCGQCRKWVDSVLEALRIPAIVTEEGRSHA